MNYKIDSILNRNNYGKIYNLNYFIICILLIFIYIIFTYKFETYYYFKGKIVNNNLEVLINLDELDYLSNNNTLIINNLNYTYKIVNISNLYIDNNYHNYLYAYLEINNLTNINNYIYEFKIKKDNKVLAKYLIDYI